jgi:hypothetical protein
VHARQRCQPEQATVPTDDPRTLPTNGANAAGQAPEHTERLREEEEERRGKPRPDWPLVRIITRAVAAAPGGGLHRAELAGSLRLSAYRDPFKTALMIAYKRGQVDFCGAPGQHNTGTGFTEVGEERRQGHSARRRPPCFHAAWSLALTRGGEVLLASLPGVP